MFIELTETIVTDEVRQNRMEAPITLQIACIRSFNESLGRTYLTLLPNLVMIEVKESYKQITDKLFLKGY